MVSVERSPRAAQGRAAQGRAAQGRAAEGSPTECRFVLRPNQSLSWRGTQLCFLGLCVGCGAIAAAMTALGFWLILPFAGLELLAVGTGLYVVARRCQACEVIDITDDAIRIAKGSRHPEQQWILQRVWARVVLERCAKQWYPSRLWIRSHGQAVEIGSFLNEEERQHLAAELSRSL